MRDRFLARLSLYISTACLGYRIGIAMIVALGIYLTKAVRVSTLSVIDIASAILSIAIFCISICLTIRTPRFRDILAPPSRVKGSTFSMYFATIALSTVGQLCSTALLKIFGFEITTSFTLVPIPFVADRYPLPIYGFLPCYGHR